MGSAMLTTERIPTDVLVSLFGHRTPDMKLFRGKGLRVSRFFLSLTGKTFYT